MNLLVSNIVQFTLFDSVNMAVQNSLGLGHRQQKISPFS